MSDLLEWIKLLLTLEEVSIDNIVFRLHYKATVSMLLLFALVVTSKEHFGEPIDCYIGKEPLKVIDKYCWIFSTYTVREKVQMDNLDLRDSLRNHPGVGPIPYNASSQFQYKDMIKYHKYYQWVGFVLLFQALLFYIPHYLWKQWEGGRIKGLVVEVSRPVLEMIDGMEGENQRSVSNVVQSIIRYWEDHLHYHDGYAFLNVFCEFLNMTNVILQFYFLDVILGGEFLSYGSSLLEQSDIDSSKVIERIFPKVAKCTFERFGPSGSIVNIDALCVLSLNVVNEKIFAILWFWFMILSFLSAATLLYRFTCYANRKLRVSLIRSRARSISACRVKAVLRVLNYGDWFLLYQMAKNMNPVVFTKLLYEMADKFGRTNA